MQSKSRVGCLNFVLPNFRAYLPEAVNLLRVSLNADVCSELIIRRCHFHFDLQIREYEGISQDT